MLIAGIVVLSLGVGALVASTYMEWKRHEPVYALLIKVSTGLLAIGAILFGVAIGFF